MIRLRRLPPTICAFHLGFSLVVRNLCNDGSIGTEPLPGHTWVTETMAEQSGISPVISRMLVYQWFLSGSRSARGSGWKQPCLRPRWKFSLVVAQGVAGKPGFISPWQDGILLPFQPGVQQDDALRLRQGLGERAGGQELGPAGGAAGPRRLRHGQY